MLTVRYFGFLMTVLLVLVQNSEGATLINGSISVEGRRVQCNDISDYPHWSDGYDAKCTKVYSNQPRFEYGQSPEIKELLLELKCDRLTCFWVTLLHDELGIQKNCIDSMNFRRIGNSFYMVCNGTERFKDIQPGNYCIHHTEYDLRENDKSKMCYSVEQSTPIIEILPKGTTTVPTHLIEDSTSNMLVIYITVPGICVLLAVGILYVYKRRCCKRNKTQSPIETKTIPTTTLSKAIKSSPLVNIFFIYSRDCPHHEAVVEKLAQFFVANNCNVAYNGWDIEEIAKNKVGWVSEKLNGNYKIILVVSKLCYERQQAWLQNQKCFSQHDTYEESLFIQAIATIMYRIDQAFDYNKIFVVRPSYVPTNCIVSNICPGRHYVIPDKVAELLCHIHNIDTKYVRFDESRKLPYIALTDSIAAITSGNIKCDGCSQRNGYITV